MAPELNHTIVSASDPSASAQFLAQILGLGEPGRFGHFHVVTTANGVSLDFMEASGPVHPQHYAFLVTDSEFEPIFERVKEAGLAYFADPGHSVAGVNKRDGGQGFYFSDPDGHNLEVLTRPYGSGG